MQGGEANQHFTPPIVQQIETMNGEGAPEFVVDPSLYFSAAANYGYYCTGFESPSDWDDHHRIFGLDGTDVQYAGGQAENMPYVYYAPTYGYGESQFNPYNPYIPGAMIGADGSYIGAQYYAVSPYQNPVSSSGYYPVSVQTKPDTTASSSADPLFDTAPPVASRLSSSETRQSQSSSSMGFTKNPPKVGSSHSHSFGKTSEGSRANSGAGQRYPVHRNGSIGNQGSSSFVRQSQHGNNFTSQGREVAQNQMKTPLMSGPFPGSVSSAEGQGVGDGAWSKFYQRSSVDDTSRPLDSLIEQNRGPRTNKSKNQFVVKAYTKKAGVCDPQGNIVISADEYNRDDLPLDYVLAKFFVIKSYSEDDVHKSIKYNVWSSTPNGNRKLNAAYEDAQLLAAGRPRGCPIFLYFSVNASGQFCGVAEMIGPVDFQNDMDFWQQDKWSGSFPVKWHMIKDVPNTNFRHIILENNEHKPVTNSRDTQEIMYKPGMEMLKIFKNFTPKTSLLDDFLYYENRQKIMVEERARYFHKHITPSFQPVGEISGTKGTEHTPAPPFLVLTKTEPTLGQTSSVTKIPISSNPDPDPINSGKMIEEKTRQVSLITKADTSIADNGPAKKQNMFQPNTSDAVSSLKIGSLTINPKQTDHKPLAAKVTTGFPDVVTVGSVPVKVNGHNIKRTSGILTVGTIPLDPKSLHPEKGDAAGKGQILPKKSNV